MLMAQGILKSSSRNSKTVYESLAFATLSKYSRNRKLRDAHML